MKASGVKLNAEMEAVCQGERMGISGARVCDPQQPPEVGAAAARVWMLVLEGCWGSQTRAPVHCRGLGRFEHEDNISYH